MQISAVLDKFFAGTIVLICVLLLARQFIAAKWRGHVDAALLGAGRAVRARVQRLWRWPSARRSARREAEAAIRRASERAGEWDGNVYRTKTFGKSRKLH